MAHVMPINYRGVDKGDEVWLYTAPPVSSFREISNPTTETFREIPNSSTATPVPAWIGVDVASGPDTTVVTNFQPASAPVDSELIQAVNDLLDSDGSRGTYDAIKRSDAREKLEKLLTSTPPVPVMTPVKLPKSERLDGNGYGYYFDMDDVFVALDEAGVKYEVQE